MDVKPGYKMTEVGVIPEEWDVSSLAPFANSTSSGTSKHSQSIGTHNVYGSTGVIGLTEKPEYEGEAILVARVGANAGRLQVVSGKYGVTDNTILLKLKSTILLEYVWRKLESLKLNRLVFGSGQPLITGSQIKLLLIPIPPLPEQRAIAAALSDVDALIESLEKLIAKKRDVKQATMQQLLTGAKRLPGFEGEWEVKRLGEIATVKKGELITSDMAVKGSIPVIAGGKLPAYYHNAANRNGPTVTISASGANAGFVSYHSLPIFASDCSTIEEGIDFSLMYLYYQLRLRQQAIYKSQTGGAQPHVHPVDLNPIEIPMPCYEEQVKIANVLSDADSEIEALEARRDKTKLLKQGMMQELLTGKTRLV